jgi:D-alanine--(R)-lactate ligase
MAILFGGRSEEHPVSLKSAREVARHLDLDRYQPYWVGITRAGAWRLCDGPATDLDRDGLRPVMLSLDPEIGGLVVLGGEPEVMPLDLIFPVLHGRGGEDGSIQGLVAASGIPAIGCDTSGSILAFDKSLTYLVAQAAGVRTPTFRVLEADDEVDAASIEYPAFVKPARSGSSFGVSRVHDGGELAAAVETARAFDSKVLIETAVIGEEIGCAILGNGSELTLGALDRVAMSHGFFRIHQESNPEAGSENAEFIVPADISPEAAEAVRAVARTVYRALGCRGLARVDLFLRGDGAVVLNEVNTMPGLTSYSRFPRMMAAAGLSLTEVIDRLVELAMADAQERSR